MRNKNVLSACSLFEKLPQHETVNFEKFKDDVKMLTEKEGFHIFDLFDKIMISLYEIPREIITLPIFKHWCDFKIFEKMLCSIIMDNNHSKNLKRKVILVHLKCNRFFLRGLIHFKKMNIKVLDADINAQNSESSVVNYKEKMLMLVIKRIKNCETIQDLIDSSPNEECSICMDVTFTESTPFLIRVNCNHLVCLSCTIKLEGRLVEKYIIFLSLILFKIFYNVDPLLFNSG